MKINVKEYEKALQLGWRLVENKKWLEDIGEVYYTFTTPVLEALGLSEGEDSCTIIGFDPKKDYEFNTSIKHSGTRLSGLMCKIAHNGMIGRYIEINVNVGNKALQYHPFEILQDMENAGRFSKLFKINYGTE